MNTLNERIPEIRSVMLPRDTNYLGSIFGGHILSLIDLAAGQHARRVAPHRYVTKVMREVNFIAPVHIGDAVTFYCTTIKVGRTSVTVRVDVESNRVTKPGVVEDISVTTAEVVLVAVNEAFEPIPVR
jgi:acyl-CoA thioesterase YciA